MLIIHHFLPHFKHTHTRYKDSEECFESLHIHSIITLHYNLYLLLSPLFSTTNTYPHFSITKLHSLLSIIIRNDRILVFSELEQLWLSIIILRPHWKIHETVAISIQRVGKRDEVLMMFKVFLEMAAEAYSTTSEMLKEPMTGI